MFVEKVKSEGLAHLSWVIGDGAQAAVIDPRRDIGIYLDIARQHNVQITHVLETHRNEDLVSGAPLLGRETGARVWHGPDSDAPIRYAETIHDGQEIEFAGVRLCAMHTPGHTNDSMSYALYDTGSEGPVVAVFTGDALFIGDVGRTDFYPEAAEEVAGKLYDSLQKLLRLGDQAVLYPAHGAGSVCGSGMADREVSTIGHERATNPMLQHESREAFITSKIEEQHYRPPYFARMEQLNSEGVDAAGDVHALALLSERAVSEQIDSGASLVDIRGPEAYAGAHIPGALCLPSGLVASYAGWLLAADNPIVLIANSLEQAEVARLHLLRTGFDEVAGVYINETAKWAAGGGEFGTVPMVDVETVRERVQQKQENWRLLDIRKDDEVEQSKISGAEHVYLGHLIERLESLDPQAHYTVLCGSGMRAAVGASVLVRAGFRRVDIFLGSMGAWNR